MNFSVLATTAWREILAHKFRSLLSMLGIVLGVSSLLATMALTTGIEKGTRDFMRQLGGLEFLNVVNKEISASQMDFWNLSPGRTLQDARSLRTSAPLISHISPEFNLPAAVSAGSHTERYVVMGVWPDALTVHNHRLAAGRFLTDLDIERASRAVVIGENVRRALLPHTTPSSALGEILLINGSPFQIVGVLTFYEREQDRRMREILAKRRAGREETHAMPRSRRALRWDPFRAKNDAVLIPLSTMFHEFQAGLFPMDALESVRLDALRLRVKNLDSFQEALTQVRQILDVTHRGVDDYDIETREEWFDRMEANVSATRLSGGLISAIALVVGGIGITNIMLASISERVREIGVRMAVGARARDIFAQILGETVMIALLGGLLGIAAGLVLVEVLKIVAPMENPPVLQWPAVLLSVSFAVLAGILSGLYPALRAARMDPILALRYE